MSKRKADSDSSNDQPIEKKAKIEEKEEERDEFNCPVCWELMATPIYQCQEGHPICAKCRDNLRRMECPTCRSYGLDARCLVLEQFATKTERKCPNECGVVAPISKLLGDHKKECAKGERYSCIAGCKDYTAKSVAELIKHTKENHGVFVDKPSELGFYSHNYFFKKTDQRPLEWIYTVPDFSFQARVTIEPKDGEDRSILVYFERLPVLPSFHFCFDFFVLH